MPLIDIPGYEKRYAITRGGRVWSHARPGKWKAGFLKLHTDKDGYIVAFFSHEGRVLTKRVARLVLEVFVGPPPTAHHQANHKDGRKSNNRVGNLEWTTELENTHHSIETGLVANRTKRFVVLDGQERPFADVCREHGVPYVMTHVRVFKLGWSVGRALSEPKRKKHALQPDLPEPVVGD